jgi:O-antigen/teichoic acid export membrane protein
LEERRAVRLGFLGNINLVFLTYVANYAITFGVAVIVTRALGAEGRGIYSLFLLSVSLAQAVLSLGVGVSAIYYIGKKTYTLRQIASNTQFVVLASTAVSGLLVLLATPIFGDRLLDRDVPYWVFIFAVPLFLNFNVLIAILQGGSRFLAMNMVILAQPLMMLAMVSVGFVVGDLEIATVLVLWSIATLAAMLLGLRLVGLEHIHLPTVLVPDWRALRDQVRFGVQGQIGNLVQLLNYRLDSFIVLLFVNATGVGFYAVANGMTQGVWFVANAVAVVLLPRLTGAREEDAARLTPLVCRHTLLISALAAGGLAVLSPVLVEALFGGEFSAAVMPLLWLLPGTVALSGSKILASYVFSQGKPLINSYITLASLAVTLVADFILIPPFGVEGAAVASSLAYSAHLVFSLVMYRRISGQRISEALLVRGSDMRLYLDVARGWGARLAPQPGARS